MGKINKGAKIGIIIEIIAIAIMIGLVLFNKIIPSLIVWIFTVGLVIALISSLLFIKKSNNNK